MPVATDITSPEVRAYPASTENNAVAVYVLVFIEYYCSSQ